MALIKCPECGKEISSRATSCPNCGFPISGDAQNTQKEYRIELSVYMRIEATEQNVKVFYSNNLIVDTVPEDFVLLYCKQEPDDSGRAQLRIAFSCPQYKDTFKLTTTTYGDKYKTAREFADNVAVKHFKKDYVDSWFAVNDYARNHVDQSKADEMREKIQASAHKNIEKPKPVELSKPQSTPTPPPVQPAPKPQEATYQPQEETKKSSFFGSTGFTVVMLLFFWPVGLFTMWKYKHFKKGTRIAWSIILPLLAVFVLGSGGLNSDSVNTSSQVSQNTYEQEIQDTAKEVSEEINNSADVSDPDPTEEPEPDYVTVGSTFEVEGLQITVDDASTDFQDYEDEYGFHTPADGMKYIKVSFTYNNVGKSDKYASIYDFKCYADNQTCEQEYGLDDSSFMNTNISSGRSVSFSVYYTVPVNSQSIELEYAANIWTDEKVLIKLQ